MTPDRWDQLCLRHLAGTLADEEASEFTEVLAADPLRRQDLLRQATEEAAMRRHFDRVSIDAALLVQLRRAQARAWRTRWIVAVAAAAALACGLLPLLPTDRAADAAARPVAVIGCPDGTRVEPLLQAGGSSAVHSGDRLAVSGDGPATLGYPDGSRLQLEAGSVLEVLAPKRLHLSRGVLSALVVDQPRDTPMVIATPQLIATVPGNRFTLAVDAGATRLAVVDGTVRADAVRGGGGRMVRAGETLEIAETGLQAADGAARNDGIASRHPGDVGIAQDPDVVFADGFESGDFRNWSDGDRNPAPANLVVSDPLLVHGGRHAAQLTQDGERRPVTDLVRWLGPGRERIHVRCYIRLAPEASDDAPRAVPSVGLVAVRERNLLGTTREPDGGNYFSASIDLLRDVRLAGFRPGVVGAHGRFDVLPLVDRPAHPMRLVPGRWHCLELMLQANRPGASDGEQRMWLDGVESLRAGQLMLRSDGSLAINALWMTFLVRGASQSGRFWLDDLVVATRYIGPQAPRSAEQ